MDSSSDLRAANVAMGVQRMEGNPLDLNNLPAEDYSIDGKQQHLDGGYRKKKNGGVDECGKVYECRFCSLKFCKSQALGGHMNRHRQERETETLNRARQLVFSSDTNILAQGPHHIMGYQTSNMGMYSTRTMFPGTSTAAAAIPPPPPPPGQRPPQPYTYASHPQYPVNDYFVGHVLSTTQSNPNNYAAAVPNLENSYTCIGAPVKHGALPGGGVGSLGAVPTSGGGGRDMQPLYTNAPPISRFQDGF
ncbi:unnamed protein product [Cuscuta epithymum]|uniref:C2H2-type domain-containing protein n=1 Tax=Cuscuta epithymum TaxID=186058 RepID=A0AAV0DQU2_9ASTE|nr:unnamed protein product [Cuscuta epithymum]